MRRYGASRQELFERLDQPVLRPLPAEPFVYGEWSKARVNIDYRVEVHHHNAHRIVLKGPSRRNEGKLDS